MLRGSAVHRILCWSFAKLVGVNADLLLVLGCVLELNATVDQSEQRVIGTDTDVVAGTDSRASLTNDDVAGKDCLTVSLLYAKALRLAITAVLGGTNTLLVSKKLQTELQHLDYLHHFLCAARGGVVCNRNGRAWRLTPQRDG